MYKYYISELIRQTKWKNTSKKQPVFSNIGSEERPNSKLAPQNGQQRRLGNHIEDVIIFVLSCPWWPQSAYHQWDKWLVRLRQSRWATGNFMLWRYQRWERRSKRRPKWRPKCWRGSGHVCFDTDKARFSCELYGWCQRGINERMSLFGSKSKSNIQNLIIKP